MSKWLALFLCLAITLSIGGVYATQIPSFDPDTFQEGKP